MKCPDCSNEFRLRKVYFNKLDHVYSCPVCGVKLRIKAEPLLKAGKRNNLAWALITAPPVAYTTYLGFAYGRWGMVIAVLLGLGAASVAYSLWFLKAKAEFEVV